MSVINQLIGTGILPDKMVRFGIRKRLAKTLQRHVPPSKDDQVEAVRQHVEELRSMPVAIHTEDANEQHYELPTEFFACCLGPRMKYSSAFFETGEESLAEAEEAMLALTCQRAGLVESSGAH